LLPLCGKMLRPQSGNKQSIRKKRRIEVKRLKKRLQIVIWYTFITVTCVLAVNSWETMAQNLAIFIAGLPVVFIIAYNTGTTICLFVFITLSLFFKGLQPILIYSVWHRMVVFIPHILKVGVIIVIAK